MSVLDNIKNIVKNFADLSKEKPTYDEIGYNRDSVWSTYLDEEKSTDTIKITDYIKMQENDGEVQGITNILATPVISTGWEIVSPDGSEGGKELEFIKENFEGAPGMGGMETPLQLILADMTRAFFEGFRLYEKVWEVRNGLIYLKKLAPRDAQTITLQKDEHGDFKGAVQRVSFAGQYHEVIIEGYKTLLYTFQKQKDWLYGRSVLKSAYYHYDKKHKLYYISHKAAELQTVPPKIIKLEQSMDESQKSKLENAVDKLGVNTRVTIPSGVTLESFESKGSPTVSIKELIDHHNSQMLKSIMAQFMNLGTESNSKGSFALSQTQADYFTMFLESEMRNIASHINWYVIPQLIDWNFGTGVYPQIKFNPIKDSTKDLLQEVFKSLITGKSSSIPDVFYESILNKTSENLNLGISEQEITTGMAEKKQEVMDAEKQKQDNLNASLKAKQVDNKQIIKKTAKLADMPVDEHGRPLRESEKNINLSEIEDVMDKAEADMKANIQALYYSQKQEILDKIRKAVETKDPTLLNKISSDIQKKYAKYIYDESVKVMKMGIKSASTEMNVDIVAIPQEKLNLAMSTAESIAQKEIQDLIWIGQQEVISAIKKPTVTPGEVVGTVSTRMDDKFSYNLDMTAAINTTGSLNEGRDVVFVNNSKDIYAFDYSAILDKRTCFTCGALDGSIIAPTDPAYYKYKAPIHAHCRCMWVAIMNSEINKPAITGINPEVEDYGVEPSLSDRHLSDIDKYIPYIQQLEIIKLKSNRSQNDLDQVKSIYNKLPDKLKNYAIEVINAIEKESSDVSVIKYVKQLEKLKTIEHPTATDLKKAISILDVLPSNIRYIADEVITLIENKIRQGA